jgi:uncharacterized membrane protein
MRGKLILFLVLLIALPYNSYAAVIHGTIYDMGLDKANGAIVEVDSNPKQRMMSDDGAYSFNLPNGEYTLLAAYNDNGNLQKSAEKISVKGDGDYVIDIFLFSDISDSETLFNESDISITLPYIKDYTAYYIAAVIILLLMVGLLLYKLFFKKKTVDAKILGKDDKDLDRIILILKENGGRATQKDIRKEIPLSEAKISLMIAELESEGKIKKIKKGRGNILVLT